LNHTLLFNLD